MTKGKDSRKRTLVEFFDHEYLENTVSLLYGEYEAVTYVCFRNANEPTAEDRAVWKKFIQEKFGFQPEFLEVGEHTVFSALDAFRKMASDGGIYDFDVTGGSSVFIAAAGALLAEEPGGRICIHEYNTATGDSWFCCPADLQVRPREKPFTLTVPEVLTLRGIKTLPSDTPIRYELKGELRKEILRLWDGVRGELRAWNTFNTLPTEYTQTWTGWLVEKWMSPEKYGRLEPLLNRLQECGILSDLRQRNSRKDIVLSFRLNVPESAFVLYQKGGNLLELLTCLAVADSGQFEDCCTGIKLDWEEERTSRFSNPFNELDVVMTRGHIPYFVSCKNTEIENDYLYEIMTMTRHFGGAYAVPVLISTADSGAALRTRAQEMNVVLIDEVSQLTAQEFSQKLCAALCPQKKTEQE